MREYRTQESPRPPRGTAKSGRGFRSSKLSSVWEFRIANGLISFRTFYTNPQAREGYRASISPLPFQPPDFERLNESPAQWAKKADAAWKQYRDGLLKQWQSWVTAGVDEEIPPEKNIRGPGRSGRNAPPDAHAEWAARRLIGMSWKEIASDQFNVDQVKKAAIEMIKRAGWPTKVKPPKTSK